MFFEATVATLPYANIIGIYKWYVHNTYGYIPSRLIQHQLIKDIPVSEQAMSPVENYLSGTIFIII